MANLKSGQINITPRRKIYVTLWRPDGQPMSVNITNALVGQKRVDDLLFRGYSESAPVLEKPKAKAKAKKHEI